MAGHSKVALMVGAEGPGLTEHAMRATHERARIPMAPGTDSLNVATAAAIAFYERQRSLLYSRRFLEIKSRALSVALRRKDPAWLVALRAKEVVVSKAC